VEMNASHPMTGYVHTMYALHALAGLIGVTSGATIIGAFVFGLPSIIAIIMNYARRDAALGSWLDSHFEWQRRTFWYALAIGLTIFAGALILVLLGVVSLASTPLTGGAGALGAGAAIGGGFVALYLGAFIAGVWILYRVVRGWLALGNGKSMND
jgi:uncharacterized membrane protein